MDVTISFSLSSCSFMRSQTFVQTESKKWFKDTEKVIFNLTETITKPHVLSVINFHLFPQPQNLNGENKTKEVIAH